MMLLPHEKNVCVCTGFPAVCLWKADSKRHDDTSQRWESTPTNTSEMGLQESWKHTHRFPPCSSSLIGLWSRWHSGFVSKDMKQMRCCGCKSFHNLIFNQENLLTNRSYPHQWAFGNKNRFILSFDLAAEGGCSSAAANYSYIKANCSKMIYLSC